MATAKAAKAPKEKKEKAPKEKKEKKRAAAEEPDAAGAPAAAAAEPKAKKAKKEAKAAKAADSSGASDDTAAVAVAPAAPAKDPLAIDAFGLAAPIQSLLRAKGIAALFDIQAQCIPPLLAGSDLVGRARTGCGKTLAFVLPIVQCLFDAPARPAGRPPSALVLAPTRELAKQVRVVVGCGLVGFERTLRPLSARSKPPKLAL
jgi:ATP-dependent RNA helicase DDX21